MEEIIIRGYQCPLHEPVVLSVGHIAEQEDVPF
jgi:hypothetical protein